MTILDALDTTRDETLRHFALGLRALGAVPAPGRWSVRFLLHHLADAETVLAERIRRILSEPRPLLSAFDQDAWSRALDYEKQPLALSRDRFAATRAGTRFLAEQWYESRGHLEWVHSETGVRTLKDEFDKVAAHNEHHLRDIRAALATLRG